MEFQVDRGHFGAIVAVVVLVAAIAHGLIGSSGKPPKSIKCCSEEMALASSQLPGAPWSCDQGGPQLVDARKRQVALAGTRRPFPFGFCNGDVDAS